MKRLALPAMALFISSSALVGLAKPDGDQTVQRFRQHERDIPSLYLLNGLNLSTQQVTQIARIAQSAADVSARQAKAIERLVDSRRKDIERETADILAAGAKRKDPSGPLMPNPLLAKRIGDSRRATFEARREGQEALSRCADDLYQVLSASQRRIIENFTPCFVPPSDFRNPERVGQAAADTSFVEQVLIGMRKGGAAPSDEAMERALDRLVPYVMEKRHMPYSESAEMAVRSEMETKLRKAAERMAKMDEADFELEKKKIATDVFVPRSGVGDAQATRWKIQHYLLNPGIVDVLCARAGAAAPQQATTVPEMPDNRSAIRTAVMLAGLDLSAEQARNLLGIVDQAMVTRGKVEAEIQTAMTGSFSAYERLRKELAAGQPSRESESAASRFHVRVKMLNEDKLVEELLKHEAEVDRCLTAAQVESLSADRDTRPALMAARVAGDKALDRAKRVLTEARNSSAIEFGKQKDRMAKDFVAAYVEAGGLDARDVNADSEAKRAADVLAKARELDQAAYTSQRDALAAELCPKRAAPRDPTYGAKYHRGEPVKILSPATQLLFSQTGRDMLAALVKRL